MGEIRIGTSGFAYPHWHGPFYPAHLAARERFAFYAQRFDCVELDSTFYRLPGAAALDHLREAAPAGFVFALKAHRLITHLKKLTAPETTLPPFFERTARLCEKRGPILFQLPPHWRVNPARLTGFLAALPAGLRCAFEFRDPTWFTEAVYGALRAHGAALCLYELAGFQAPPVVTADFVYLRLHGPAAAYRGDYPETRLLRLAAQCRAWRDEALDVYCFFDKDEAGHAPRNAATLRTLCAV